MVKERKTMYLDGVLDQDFTRLLTWDQLIARYCKYCGVYLGEVDGKRLKHDERCSEFNNAAA